MEKTIKQFQVTFKNGDALQIKGAGIKNNLDAYNHICLNKLGKWRGGIEKIEDVTCYFGESVEH